MTEHPPNYESLKQMAATLDRPVATLIAQDAGADPFYANLPMRELRAHWFKHVWDRLDIKPGAHLRRIHYQLVSQAPPIELPREVNGTWEYINTFNCWAFLGDAASDARYLGLIPFDHIADQRNTATVVGYDGTETPGHVLVSLRPKSPMPMRSSGLIPNPPTKMPTRCSTPRATTSNRWIDTRNTSASRPSVVRGRTESADGYARVSETNGETYRILGRLWRAAEPRHVSRLPLTISNTAAQASRTTIEQRMTNHLGSFRRAHVSFRSPAGTG
jgi:hypothetical protein